jgi:hypothetical protein
MIIFNFVCLRDAVLTKRFLDKLPKGVECIDYMAVSNKLAKNDYAGQEPSDDVVASHLIKLLRAAVNSQNKEEIYYVISSTDRNIMESIKAFLTDATQAEISYTLVCTPAIANKTVSSVPTRIHIVHETT